MHFSVEGNATATNVDSSNNAQLTITTDGNVGIGTVAPTSKLHVVGDSKLAGDINQDANYLLNSQTVNDLQTRSSYWFDNSGGTTGLVALGTYSRIAITDNNALDITGANTIELVVEFNELGLKQTLFIKVSNSSSNWYSYHLRLNTDDKIYYALM